MYKSVWIPGKWPARYGPVIILTVCDLRVHESIGYTINMYICVYTAATVIKTVV